MSRASIKIKVKKALDVRFICLHIQGERVSAAAGRLGAVGVY